MTTTIKPIKQPISLNGHHTNGAKEEPVDAFPYGWRTVAEIQADGSTRYVDIPLTQADFLDPQVGDHLVQSHQHAQFVVTLINRFSAHYEHDPTTGVFSDLKMLWGIPGEKEPAPDLAIVPNIKDNEKKLSSFAVKKEGARPCLVIEVVSAHYPGDDTTKVDIYERVGIEEYMIIDAHWEEDDGEIELTGYRLVNGRYRRIRPDPQGRLFSKTTNVWFALDETKRDLLLTNAITGKRLLKYKERGEALLAERQRAEVADQRAEVADQRAEMADQRAEMADQRAEAERQRAEMANQRAAAAEAEIARLRKLYGL